MAAHGRRDALLLQERGAHEGSGRNRHRKVVLRSEVRRRSVQGGLPGSRSSLLLLFLLGSQAHLLPIRSNSGGCKALGGKHRKRLCRSQLQEKKETRSSYAAATSQYSVRSSGEYPPAEPPLNSRAGKSAREKKQLITRSTLTQSARQPQR